MVRKINDFLVVVLTYFFVNTLRACHTFRLNPNGKKTIDIIQNFIKIGNIITPFDQTRYDNAVGKYTPYSFF